MKLNLLKNKNYIFLFLARGISIFGDSIDDIAFTLLVYELTGSSLMMGIILSLKVIISFCSIFFGVFSDKLSKKTLINIGEYGQSIVLILVASLYTFKILNVYILILAVIIQAFFGSISLPAKNSITPYIVKKEELLKANSCLNIENNVLQIIGYSTSILLINITSIGFVIFIDSLTFISAAIFYKFIDIPQTNTSKKINWNIYKFEFTNGFKFLMGNKVIYVIIILSAIANFSIAPINVLMPLYFEVENLNIYYLSIFQSTLIIGTILGTFLLIKTKGTYIKTKNIFPIGFFLSSISMVSLACLKNIYIILSSALFIGISISIISIMTTTILQELIPKEMLGRVGSVFKLSIYIAIPMGNIVVGGLGNITSINIIFFIFGLLMMFVYIFSIKFKINSN